MQRPAMTTQAPITRASVIVMKRDFLGAGFGRCRRRERRACGASAPRSMAGTDASTGVSAVLAGFRGGAGCGFGSPAMNVVSQLGHFTAAPKCSAGSCRRRPQLGQIVTSYFMMLPANGYDRENEFILQWRRGDGSHRSLSIWRISPDGGV